MIGKAVTLAAALCRSPLPACSRSCPRTWPWSPASADRSSWAADAPTCAAFSWPRWGSSPVHLGLRSPGPVDHRRRAGTVCDRTSP